jgi:hypothetical protein
MILESWEMRWFGKGAVPIIFQQWSEENGLTTQPVRTDHYLMHKAGKAMGIKWREGNLQIKELVGKETKKPTVGHYKKWSFELKEDDLLQKIEAHEEWVAVAKKRDLAKWRVEEDTLHRTDPGNEEIGIELEISAVMCKEKLWWTIAFEATGGVENLEKGLKEIKIPEIKEAHRMGYAEWLEKI